MICGGALAHHAHHVSECDYGNPWELLKQSSPLTVGCNWFRRGLLQFFSVESVRKRTQGALIPHSLFQLDVRPFYSSSWGWGLVIKPCGTRVTVCCLGRGLVIWCESSLPRSNSTSVSLAREGFNLSSFSMESWTQFQNRSPQTCTYILNSYAPNFFIPQPRVSEYTVYQFNTHSPFLYSSSFHKVEVIRGQALLCHIKL